MMKFNIYVPSYKRSDTILTNEYLEYCTYVVRESEKELYENAGVDVLAVEDNKIDGISKVQNWLIDNAEEDVIAIIDDDIDGFIYRIDTSEKIKDKEIATREIERLAQLIYDLDLGYCSPTNEVNPMYYNAEFKFCGVVGQIKIINRHKVKSRYNDIPYFSDVDFVLQECLKNRVILLANYFTPLAHVDTNKGGSNINKTLKQWNVANDTMKNKWGKYWGSSQQNKPAKLRVKR